MNFLGKIFSGGATELIEGVGNALDKLTTSKDEKLEAERKVKELVANYEIEMEKNITSRWEADLKSDSWLSKNVRPLVLIFLIVCTMLLIFIDAGALSFEVKSSWVDLLQLVLITVIGAYFGGRSLEKVKK
tara:strand:+ start:1353 stop:1745 length:393 start_codon:yes stop_codon:yes gene_type:complete